MKSLGKVMTTYEKKKSANAENDPASPFHAVVVKSLLEKAISFTKQSVSQKAT